MGEIKHVTTNKSHEISSNSRNNFTPTSLLKIQESVQQAEPANIPLTIRVNHRQADNPYESCYGDNWKESIKRAPKMKGTICITTLIEHIMVQETKCVFTDTNYDKNCFFHHDPITQMTNKDMKEWMREKGYLNMWVLPMKGCNAGSPYANSSVGDSPEMMPLDSSLFEDLHAGVHHHITRTMLLDAKDPKWFSLAMPTKVA